MSSATYWLAIGFLGQARFFARILVGWGINGFRGKDVLRHVFWWFAPAGSAILRACAIRRKEPVSCAGQAVGPIVSMRGQILILAGAKSGTPP